MRTTSRLRRHAVAALAAACVAGTGQLLSPLTPPAAADTVPAVAGDPANPETVSARPLPTVQVDGVVWSQAVVGNTVYVGGQFTTARPAGSAPGVNTVTRANLLAYDIRTGNLVTSWAPSTDGAVQVVKASPDGTRIYAGGTFTTVNGTPRRRLAAIDATTGALVGSFNPNPDAKVSAIATSGSTVYFGGSFGTAGGATRSRLAAMTSGGVLLPWAPVAAGGQVAALTLTPDSSKVVVGGQFTTVNGSSNPGYGLAALDPTTGALVPWAANATIRNGGDNASITSLTTDSDSVYATGFVFGPGGNLEGSARINGDGTVNWVEDCHGDSYSAFPMGGAVYKVGHAHYCGNVPGGFSQPKSWRFYRGLAFSKVATGVARADYLNYANWAGTKDPSILQWYPQLDTGTFTGQTQAAWSLAGNNDYVVAGGEFPKADGTAQQGLVRYARKSVSPDTKGPQLSYSSFVPTVTSPGEGEALVSWQADYDRDSRNLTYQVIRNGNTASPVYTVTRGSNPWERPYLSFLDTGLTPGSTVTYRIQAVDPAGNVARSNLVSVTVASGLPATDGYARAVLKDGPESYWRLDETSGAAVADLTGLHPMTATAGVTLGSAGALAGHRAATLASTGTPTAATGTLQEGPFAFSVEAWFQTSSTTGGRIVGFSGSQSGTSASGTADRHLYLSNNGQLNFGVKQGTALRTLTSSTSYNDSQWHQAVGVLGDDGMRLYVDGVRVGQRTDTRTAGSYSGYWRVGGDNLTGWANRPTSDYLSGTVDEVAVFASPLTGAQVRGQYLAAGKALPGGGTPTDAYGATVYNDGPDLFWRFAETGGSTAADASLNGQPGVYTNGPTLGGASGVGVAGDRSVSTDGSNDTVASATATTAPPVYSEETWFKTTSTTGGQLMGFGSAKTGASATHDRQVFLASDGTVRFSVAPASGEVSIRSTSRYNDGTWHHVVATQAGTGMRLYVDGGLVADEPTLNAAGYTGYWRVGGDSLAGRASRPASDYLNGSLDEVAVYTRALSAAEVASHFVKGGGAVPNKLPVASFTAGTTGRTVTVDAAASTDPDGTVTGYAWDFGDGSTGTGVGTSHRYAAPGTYTVTLTVTDDRGGSATTSRTAVVVNAAPTAAFGSSTQDLTASFDAAGSADADGTVTSYAWDFGDGTSGTTSSPTHGYLVAGTYDVTLTVTDNDGATDTVTHPVTVAAPVGNGTVARDAFGRTVSNGWGSADAGGAWTSTGTASQFAVSGGTGSMTNAAGATRTMTLGSVSAADSDVTFGVTMDKIADGGGTTLWTGSRQSGTSAYRTRVKVGADGRLTLALLSTVSNVDTVLTSTLLPATTTLTPGAQLQVRMQTQGSSPTTVRARVWLAGTAEPGSWQVTGTDGAPGLQTAGALSLSLYVSASATNAPVVSRFDDLLAGTL